MHNIKELQAISSEFRVLYVEDEKELRESLTEYLSKIFRSVETAENGEIGLQKYKEQPYDIVITDILMPKMNGIEMITEIIKLNSDQDIIVVSAYAETNYFIDCIKLGVNEYILKPINYKQINNVLLKTSKNLIKTESNLTYKKYLENTIKDKTDKIVSLQKETIVNFESTILALVEVIEERDSYTGGHSQRIANYSKLIAQRLQCSLDECETIYKAGILHDIGKIVTPDSILLKPNSLNELEYELIQKHVQVGYELLSKIPMYKEIAEVMVSHHERYDGTGYPNSLKAEEIPFLARIMTVADAFDAMTTNRIYKARMSVDEALEELLSLSGTQFDANIVNVAVEVLKDVEDDIVTSQEPFTDVEKARFAYFHFDQITGAYNIDYLNHTLNQNLIYKEFNFLHVLLFRNFSQYNKRYGWSAGDRLLHDFVNILKKIYPKNFIYRMHGDNFVLTCREKLEIDVDKFNNLDIIKSNNILIEEKYINLNEIEIKSLEDIEKSINS